MEKITWESFLSKNKALTKNLRFDPKVTSSLVGDFFVAGPLGGLTSVQRDVLGHAESIGTFSMNICCGSKNRNFSSGGVRAIGPNLTNFDQILNLLFFTRLSL